MPSDRPTYRLIASVLLPTESNENTVGLYSLARLLVDVRAEQALRHAGPHWTQSRYRAGCSKPVPIDRPPPQMIL